MKRIITDEKLDEMVEDIGQLSRQHYSLKRAIDDETDSLLDEIATSLEEGYISFERAVRLWAKTLDYNRQLARLKDWNDFEQPIFPDFYIEVLEMETKYDPDFYFYTIFEGINEEDAEPGTENPALEILYGCWFDWFGLSREETKEVLTILIKLRVTGIRMREEI